jgi:hypothetical protein
MWVESGNGGEVMVVFGKDGSEDGSKGGNYDG